MALAGFADPRRLGLRDVKYVERVCADVVEHPL